MYISDSERRLAGPARLNDTPHLVRPTPRALTGSAPHLSLEFAVASTARARGCRVAIDACPNPPHEFDQRLSQLAPMPTACAHQPRVRQGPDASLISTAAATGFVGGTPNHTGPPSLASPA